MGLEVVDRFVEVARCRQPCGGSRPELAAEGAQCLGCLRYALFAWNGQHWLQGVERPVWTIRMQARLGEVHLR